MWGAEAAMVITDIDILRDGGTILFRIVDGPFAGDYRLQTPFRGHPCPIFRDEVRIYPASPEERRLLEALLEWRRNLPPETRSGCDQGYVQAVIRCLERRHFGRAPGRVPQLVGAPGTHDVNGLEPALPGAVPGPAKTLFSHSEIRRFIDAYTSDDVRLIAYEPSERFRCANDEFREEVLAVALIDLRTVPMSLVRDLYRAETDFSRVRHGIDPRTLQLAEHMLWQGGDAYILDYLDGKAKGFDSSQLMDGVCMTAEFAEHLLDWVRKRQADETEANHEIRALFEDGIHLFGRWVDALTEWRRS